MTPLVLGILLPFRAYPVALTADIEKAFLNISVNQEHRDYLRFLIYLNLNLNLNVVTSAKSWDITPTLK